MSTKILLSTIRRWHGAARARSSRRARLRGGRGEDGMIALERILLEKAGSGLADLVMKGMRLDVLQKLHEMDPKAIAIVVSAEVQDSSREMAAPAAPDF
jgi:hypothetical protein